MHMPPTAAPIAMPAIAPADIPDPVSTMVLFDGLVGIDGMMTGAVTP